jgi:hypothetical protein
MKAIARVLVTATALATLSALGTAANASPQVDGPKVSRPAPAASQGYRCDAGHGPQVDCADPGTPAAGAPVPVASPSLADRAARPALALFGLLAGTLVAAAAWLRRQRRPREAI